MKIPGIRNFRSVAGKVMMGVVLAVMVGSVSVTPARGDGNRGRGERHDDRRYENRGRGYGRDRHYVRGGRGYYRPYYGYRERVYVEPPVVYAPPPPPGIRIFLPPIIIR
ncbi:hypothetical protein F6V25_15355 [Oryzomonas japonica]|uniref:Uncharacterized protein n=1 Tax=Oryzomonas japonica TaxID=2603858 RepID=A0A7J4ZMY7_9BACT|nr:hypothetical protein [Oryzomonas japonica]KAB0663807.1 hypothetical protein F6V25_15355 [Oryzomonas japonica]